MKDHLIFIHIPTVSSKVEILISYDTNFLSVLFIFNRINSTARFGSQGDIKLGIFTESTSIAEEWIFLIIVYCSVENKLYKHLPVISFWVLCFQCITLCTTTKPLPAFVTLKHIFPTVATDSRVGGDWGTTAGTLKSLSRGLQVIIEICILYHQITGHNGDWEFHLNICLTCGQGHFSRLVPKSRSEK